ncbi:Plasmodium variant antigen protein Cir/Yir/Bir/Plasmodium vivax Vir protein, putative [Plasmodium chabaudi adami]|uniref:Plasmodium variant antigen protein Cir/Yir/Bir/Plasmodium vivax Vir protein, putative n=1 Tax=Plasmodium chabaudi adami TaxID=5826 RepID=A0A1C6WGS0_PLACE|nr:Plasmodium variant antigen protein Cir/Yir/Bir/Plasmodium vivax Vir protein, putative [Plasmodium chabaudi adami]
MSDGQLCKLILDADNLFTNDQVVNETIFKQDGRYDQYCHVKNGSKKCETNIHRIGALSTYLFIQLGAYHNNDYGKYFLMWLSDKLYNIVKDKNDDKDKITLNEAYEKYLKENIGNYNYWNVLHNIRCFKDANLRHMHEFYTLLKHICNTIADYKTNGAKSKELYKYSAKCLNQYRTLYENIPGCNSYLHLLDKLKKIYSDFRDSAIKKETGNHNLDQRLQKLTTAKKVDSYFAKDFKEHELNNLGCDNLHPQTKQQQQPQSPSTQAEKNEKVEIALSQSLSLLQSLSQLLSQSIPQSLSQLSQQSEPSSQSIEENYEDNEQTHESQEPTSNPTTTYEQVTISDNSGIDVKEIISEVASSGNIINEYKLIAFSFIAIAIPVILAVMYKYLVPGLRKRLKRTSMKKVINLCDEKKAQKEVKNAFIEKNQSE